MSQGEVSNPEAPGANASSSSYICSAFSSPLRCFEQKRDLTARTHSGQVCADQPCRSGADGRSHVTLNMSLILKGAERCQLPLNSAESKGRIRPQSVLSSRGLSNSQLLFKLGWFGGFPPISLTTMLFFPSFGWKELAQISEFRSTTGYNLSFYTLPDPFSKPAPLPFPLVTHAFAFLFRKPMIPPREQRCSSKGRARS